MKLNKLIIIGGYGNGTVVQSTVQDINSEKKIWDLIGFLNDNETEPINNCPVLGKIDRSTVEKFLNDPDIYFFYSLISLKLNFKFLPKLINLGIPRERFATLIHPTAVVSEFSKIGYGTAVQPLVSIGPNTIIGDHVHIFAQALIGHGSRLDNYSYVANNACIGADVHLKEGAYLGTNATTIEFISLGKWSVTGIGAVVLKDVPDFTKVVGNPARQIGIVE